MDEIDALYALPPAEFVTARDELAKRVRKEGDKEAAAEVKALRRPTVAAAALNRTVRANRELVAELLAAAGNLRRAHERLVAGKGDRAVLREASEHARDVVSRLTAEAGAGQSESVVERVRATLQAAVVDAGVAEAVAAGRLDREAEPGGVLPVAAGPARKSGKSPKTAGDEERATAARAESPKSRPARDGKGSTAAREAAAKAESDRARREEARELLREAQRVVREAERAAETATKRADRAEHAASELRERLQEAEAAAAEARQDADKARAALRAAKETCAAAQAALGEAEQRRRTAR